IGMTDVTRLARTLAVPRQTVTSTFCRTNLATISAARSLGPSAHRTLIAAARPSIQPTACSRCTKAVTAWLSTEAVVGLENPIGGSACCARAASRQAAAAPPRSVMNSRRFIRSPQLPNDWLDGAPCLPEHVFRNGANRRPEHAKKPRVGGAEFTRTSEGERA